MVQATCRGQLQFCSAYSIAKSGAVLISDVAPPSWRLNAGWKPALRLKSGQHPKSLFSKNRQSFWEIGASL
jgi:hypothetical protein